MTQPTAPGGGRGCRLVEAEPERELTGVPLPPGAPPPLTQAAGRARLGALAMPRLLVVGERDAPGPLGVAERVAAEAPARPD
jgi:hypothetical protein